MTSARLRQTCGQVVRRHLILWYCTVCVRGTVLYLLCTGYLVTSVQYLRTLVPHLSHHLPVRPSTVRTYARLSASLAGSRTNRHQLRAVSFLMNESTHTYLTLFSYRGYTQHVHAAI